MCDTPPLISIITPTYNRAHLLGQAIESVRSQGKDLSPQEKVVSFEHIIVDGNSSDGTPALLANYPHLRVLSEPDNGLYDAINKGIRMARGEWIGLLNSDDLYEEGIFTRLPAYMADPTIEAVMGCADIFQDMPGESTYSSGSVRSQESVRSFSAFDASKLLLQATEGSPVINAWFFKKTVFAKVGSFNQRFKIGADRDWLIRFYREGIPYRPISEMVCHYRSHPESLTFNQSAAWAETSIGDYLSISRQYFRDDNRIVRQQCKAWHKKVALQAAAESLYHREMRRFAHYFTTGAAHHPTFIADFSKRMLTALFKRF